MTGRPVLFVKADRQPSAGGIWPLLHATPNTLGSIAPETAARLVEPVSGARFHLRDSSAMVANATHDADGAVITVSSGLAEAIWCCAYANVEMGRSTTEQARRNDRRDAMGFNAAPGTPMRAALDLFDAGLGLALFSTPVDWSGRPAPVPPATGTIAATPAEQAGEMALAALAYILHHEVAHLSLKHEGCGMLDPQWTLDEEREADSYAVDWILDDAPDRSAPVGKRAWGMVIALSFLTTIELVATVRFGTDQSARRTHPHSHARLDKAVKHDRVQCDPPTRETVLQLACASLLVPIRAVDLPLDGTFKDFAACYEAMLTAIAQAVVA